MPPLIMEGDATFQLEVNENKGCRVSPQPSSPASDSFLKPCFPVPVPSTLLARTWRLWLTPSVLFLRALGGRWKGGEGNMGCAGVRDLLSQQTLCPGCPGPFCVCAAVAEHGSRSGPAQRPRAGSTASAWSVSAGSFLCLSCLLPSRPPQPVLPEAGGCSTGQSPPARPAPRRRPSILLHPQTCPLHSGQHPRRPPRTPGLSCPPLPTPWLG